jgi:predicted pyridoxine 5'-phosphate oxidase superfamily flavin-nucleotide-binding protein
MMPDRRGNNRACSLRNLVRDPRMALFLIPGSDSTLRFNGRAQISIDPGLLRSFRVDAKARREYHAKPRTR